MTYLELQTALYSLLGVDTNRYNTDVAKLHINQGIRALSLEYDAPWDETTATFPTAASDKDYDPETVLGSNPPLLRPLALYIAGAQLQHVSREEYRRRYEGASEGTPEVWIWWGNLIYLGPTPNAIATVTLDYLAQPKDLSADGDTNNWTKRATTAVLYRSAELALLYLLEENRAGAMRQAWQAEMDRLAADWAARHPVEGLTYAAGTLAQVRDALGAMLSATSDRYPLVVRTAHINEAITQLSVACDQAPMDEATGTFNFTIGQQDYDVDTLLGSSKPFFGRPILLSYVNSSGLEFALDQFTFEEFKDTWPSHSTNAPPEHFALWGRQVWVGPPPDSTYTLTLRYYGVPRPLSADADTNSWTLLAADLVLAASAELGALWLKDAVTAATWRGHKEELLGRYRNEWSQRSRSARDEMTTHEKGGGW